MSEQMTWERWHALPRAEREKQRAEPTPACLKPYLGDRIEATDEHGERRRFWVGVSTGWKPSYLEVHNTRSMGGCACWGNYTDIRVIRRGPRR